MNIRIRRRFAPPLLMFITRSGNSKLRVGVPGQSPACKLRLQPGLRPGALCAQGWLCQPVGFAKPRYARKSKMMAHFIINRAKFGEVNLEGFALMIGFAKLIFLKFLKKTKTM